MTCSEEYAEYIYQFKELNYRMDQASYGAIRYELEQFRANLVKDIEKFTTKYYFFHVEFKREMSAESVDEIKKSYQNWLQDFEEFKRYHRY